MITRRSWRALVRVAALAMAVALCFGSVPMAYASIEEQIDAVTYTNPNSGTDEDTQLDLQWRKGWGNTVPVHFEISGPSEMSGFLYDLTRFPSLLDTSTPSAYMRSASRTGTHFSQNLDLAGSLANHPEYDGTVLYPGQATKPIEGMWGWVFAPYQVDPIDLSYYYASTQHLYEFGVDQTPPSVPVGTALYADVETTTPISGGVLTQRRAHLRWTNKQYDSLSGVAFFNIYVDGKLKLGWLRSLTAPSEGMPWYGAGAPGGITLEDLGAGRHTVQMSAMDRATNESAKSPVITVFVDPDEPVVSITSPSAGGKLGVKPTVKATIKDLGGVKAVGFKIDSSNMGTITPSTVTTNYAAAKTLDLSAFANGGHTLTVTGLDMAGRTVTKAVSFTLDKSAPSMSITSKGPNPFYPRKREGYKDNYIVKFNTNEAGTAYLDIYYGGKLYRSVKKSMVSGANSISWDGKSSSGALKAASYSVKLRLVDAAGNTRTSSSFGATIRFYEVVRTSSGAARVIQR